MPIIFEPAAALAQFPNVGEMWLVVSNSDPIYGGCEVHLSTDGGSSYRSVGRAIGNAVTGQLAADWAAEDDPDTTNDLLLDVSESLGVLPNFAAADRDTFLYPCWIEGGNVDVPYELISYKTATLSSAYNYTIESADTIRRAVYGASTPGSGVFHASGSKFALLDPAERGLLRIPMRVGWIGKTLKFKFAAFNKYGAGIQDLSGLTVYDYTPLGTTYSAAAAFATSYYFQDPQQALSQAVSTFDVAVAAITVRFASQQVLYAPRTFTVSDPGGSPQIYYVTIYDPNRIGETGGTPVLNAYCETTLDRVGALGYIYVGSIAVTHAGGATAVTPGGSLPALHLASGL